MANDEQLALLNTGVDAWNTWREKNQNEGVDLRNACLKDIDLAESNLVAADFYEADLSGSSLQLADLTGANFLGACLAGADLESAIMAEANLTETDLRGADMSRVHLERATMIGTMLEKAVLDDSNIYGVSAWDIVGCPESQNGLIVTLPSQPTVTVDDLQMAQFVHLLLRNKRIRGVIDAVASKAVLIIGSFSDQRKPTLDALREALREKNLTPIVFDFTVPSSRDVTETVRTLAGISRFVLADVTDATEVRAELHNVVPDFPSLPVKPLLLEGKEEFVSLKNLEKYPWVLPVFEYRDKSHLLQELDDVIKEPLAKTARVIVERDRGQ